MKPAKSPSTEVVVAPGSDLNPRQRKFVELYHMGSSATAAYIAAGYDVSDEVASTNAARLLGNARVSSYLVHLIEKASQSLEVNEERWRREEAIAFYANPQSFLDKDGRPARLADLTPDVAKGLDTYELDAEGRLIKVKLRKDSASGRIMRYLRLDKPDTSTGLTIPAPPPGTTVEVSVKMSAAEAYRKMIEGT